MVIDIDKHRVCQRAKYYLLAAILTVVSGFATLLYCGQALASPSLQATFSLPTPPWQGGYSGDLEIKNLTASTLPAGAQGWSLQLKFENKASAEDVFKSGPWNFRIQIASDGTVTLTPQSWSAAIPPSGSIRSGFNGGTLANLRRAKALDSRTVSVVFAPSIDAPPATPAAVSPAAAAPITSATLPSDPSHKGYSGSDSFNNRLAHLPAIPNAKPTFSLRVKGWGDHLEMGTVMIPEPSKDEALARSGLKALFKYAGDGGDGDPGAVYFGKKWGNRFFPSATQSSLDMAQRSAALRSRANLFNGEAARQSIMPVMVVYTCQLSGGPTAAEQDLLDRPTGPSAGEDTEFLRDHYANLIVETALIAQRSSASNPYPGSLLLNPDMLGAMQQGNVVDSTFRKANGDWVTIKVREKLQAAIDYVYAQQTTAQEHGYRYKLPARKPAIPADLSNDLKGWFQSQNWVIKTFGENKVTFGWQINLWAQGTSTWVHGVGGDKNQPHTAASIWREAAGPVALFLDYLGVYTGHYPPDYIAFDRYEFDDFREAARNINYAYDAQDWKNFLLFTRLVSSHVQKPAMLWQIPASHLLARTETIPSDTYIALHAGTGGTFFMGDAALGTGITHLHDQIKAIPLNGQPYFAGAKTVGSWLGKDTTHNWSHSQLALAVESNVFAILWGGGNTMGVIETAATGNDGGWMMRQVQKYYRAPLKLPR